MHNNYSDYTKLTFYLKKIDRNFTNRPADGKVRDSSQSELAKQICIDFLLG